MPIQLVTRGDDAGVSRSANLAIRSCFEQGILRNASLMAPTAHIEHAVDQLAGLDGLCLGLHLTLTCEWARTRFGPVETCDALWLDEDGTFPAHGGVLHERQAPAEEMLRELAAQLDRLTSLGAEISYVDQHMGVGWVDDLEAGIDDFCQAKGLINASVVPGLPAGDGPDGNHADLALARLAAAPEDGAFVLLAHPCRDDEEMRGFAFRTPGELVAVGADRAGQALVFTDPRILALVREREIQPACYSDVV